jgi:hypothetical protein
MTSEHERDPLSVVRQGAEFRREQRDFSDQVFIKARSLVRNSPLKCSVKRTVGSGEDRNYRATKPVHWDEEHSIMLGIVYLGDREEDVDTVWLHAVPNDSPALAELNSGSSRSLPEVMDQSSTLACIEVSQVTMNGQVVSYEVGHAINNLVDHIEQS